MVILNDTDLINLQSTRSKSGWDRVRKQTELQGQLPQPLLSDTVGRRRTKSKRAEGAAACRTTCRSRAAVAKHTVRVGPPAHTAGRPMQLRVALLGAGPRPRSGYPRPLNVPEPLNAQTGTWPCKPGPCSQVDWWTTPASYTPHS